MTDTLQTPIFQKTPIGYNDWRWIKTSNEIPYGLIPSSYIPTNEIWVDSEVEHSVVQAPWTMRDPFTEFLSTATTGGLTGALVGIGLASEALAEKQTTSWGLSGEVKIPPQFGYCIGTHLKEQIYCYMFASKPMLGVSVDGIREDLIIRSTFKQMHILDGTIKNVSQYSTNGWQIDNNKLTLNIGINKKFIQTTPIENISIKISSPSNKTETTYKISEISTNCDIVISIEDPSDSKNKLPTPSIGDYYILSRAISIEDPYLMDGFWLGCENEGKGAYQASPYNMYLTTTNVPCILVSITGVYYCLDENSQPVSFESGEKISSSPSKQWYFCPTQYYSNSELYGSDKKRYEILEYSDGALFSKEIPEGSIATLDLILKTNPKHLRIEISSGASIYQSNFNTPALKSQYLKSTNYTFEILDQINGITIDVSYSDVLNKKLLSEFFSTTFYIYNKYSWCMNEYYMDRDRNKMIEGKITKVEKADISYNNNVYNLEMETIDVNNSTMIDLPPRSYSPAYMPSKSFINRVALSHVHNENEPFKLYTKGDGYIMYINDAPFEVFSVDSMSLIFKPFKISIVSKTKPEINSQSYVTFGKKISKRGSFDGILNIKISQGINKSSNIINLIMSGYFLSPVWGISISQNNTYVGICSGTYFGIGDKVANSNSNATVFVTTPGGVKCISSSYNHVNNSQMMLFNDYYTKKITIRKGECDFQEHPYKIEVCIGNPTLTETTTPESYNTIYLNKQQERVKDVELTLQKTDSKSSIPVMFNQLDDPKITPLIFTTTDKNFYYGFFTTGRGERYLAGGVNNSINKEEIIVNDKSLSPVYMYKYLQNNFTQINTLNIGMSTDDSPLKIINGNVTFAKISYVKNNQTLENIGVSELIRTYDGECILFFNKKINSFDLKGESDKIYLNNSEENKTLWKHSNSCIMAIGSFDDGFNWGCPLKRNKHEENQYALMIMNSAEFLTIMYNKIKGSITIIAKNFNHDGAVYLGAFTMQIDSLSTNTYLCAPKDPNEIMFLYRQPKFISYTFGLGIDKPSAVEISTGFVYDPKTNKYPPDLYSRIIGKESTTSNINFEINNDIVCSNVIFSDGSVALLITTFDGTRALFSLDNCNSWELCPVILNKNAYSTIFISNWLFSITPNGIELLKTSESDLKNIIMNKGNNQLDKEVYLSKSSLIFSESLPRQKISGFITKDGIYKLFFYQYDNIPICLSGYGDSWGIENNF